MDMVSVPVGIVSLVVPGGLEIVMGMLMMGVRLIHRLIDLIVGTVGFRYVFRCFLS